MFATTTLLSACGDTKVASASHSHRPDSPPARTPAATAAPTTTPAAKPDATFALNQEQGYRYSGTLTMSRIHKAADLPTCQADPTTDAEIPLVITVRNDTKGFPGQPGIMLSSDTYGVAIDRGSGDCYQSGNGMFGAGLAVPELQPGQTWTTTAWVVIPQFYTPESPDGSLQTINTDTLKLNQTDPKQGRVIGNSDGETWTQGGIERNRFQLRYAPGAGLR